MKPTDLRGSLQYIPRFREKTFILAVDGTTNFTAIEHDSYGRQDTNTVTVDLRATNTFVYDLNGNLTSDGKRGLDYDDENQLIRVTVTNQFKKEYVYDGLSRLRIRREFSWGGGAWTQTNETRLVCDGVLPIQHRDANNLATLTLTRGLDLSHSLHGAGGIGGLLALTEVSGTSSFYHNDGNGNVTALLNENQLLVGKYGYDPFGYPLSAAGPKAPLNPYWFSSELWDGDTGFLHYPRRVYIPSLQRWLSRDPIEEAGGINLYRFAANNAVQQVDAFGLFVTAEEVAAAQQEVVNALRAVDVEQTWISEWTARLNRTPVECPTRGSVTDMANAIERYNLRQNIANAIPRLRTAQLQFAASQQRLAELSRLYYAAGAGIGSGLLAVGSSSAPAVLSGSLGGTVMAVGWTGVGAAAVGGYALGTAIEQPVNNAVASFFQVFTDAYYRAR